MSSANAFWVSDLISKNPFSPTELAELLEVLANQCQEDQKTVLEELSEGVSVGKGGCIEVSVDEAGTRIRSNCEQALQVVLNAIGKEVGGWRSGGSAYWQTDDGDQITVTYFDVKAGALEESRVELEGVYGYSFDAIESLSDDEVQSLMEERGLEFDLASAGVNSDKPGWMGKAFVALLKGQAPREGEVDSEEQESGFGLPDGCEAITKELLLELLPSGFESVEALSLSFSESLSDLSGLTHLKSLRYLDLSYCESLEKLHGLSDFPLLEELDLSNCESLVSLEGVSGLPGLKALDLSGCEALTSIDGLTGAPNLEKLELIGCELVSDLGVLSKLKNLREVDLSSCDKITDLSPLLALKSLEKVDLSFCEAIEEIPFDLADKVVSIEDESDEEDLSGEEGSEFDSEDSDSTSEAIGLHMGREGEWVLARLQCDHGGWLDELSITRLELGSGELCQHIESRMVVTDVPFKLIEELGPSKTGKLAALAGAEKWAKRYVVPPVGSSIFGSYVENRENFSDYVGDVPKKAVDALPFVQELRESLSECSLSIHQSIGEIALLAIGEKRTKFRTQRSSGKGSEERVNVLAKRLEKDEPAFADFDLGNYLAEVKEIVGISIQDSIDALALGIVAQDWLTRDDSRLAIVDSSGKVRPWSDEAEHYYAIPVVSKKQPPK